MGRKRWKENLCNSGILGTLESGPNFVQSVIFFS